MAEVFAVRPVGSEKNFSKPWAGNISARKFRQRCVQTQIGPFFSNDEQNPRNMHRPASAGFFCATGSFGSKAVVDHLVVWQRYARRRVVALRDKTESRDLS
jgi:hypothetical protein